MSRLLARDFPSRRFREPLCLDGGGGRPGSLRKWPCAGTCDPDAASVESLIRGDVNFSQTAGGARRWVERKTSCSDSWTELTGRGVDVGFDRAGAWGVVQGKSAGSRMLPLLSGF